MNEWEQQKRNQVPNEQNDYLGYPDSTPLGGMDQNLGYMVLVTMNKQYLPSRL